jgi:toxin FitB
MIILDTNVVAEPMRLNGSPIVTEWLNAQAAETLYLTATSLSELLLGIEFLPDGKRKEALGGKLTEVMMRLFQARILPFDEQAATVYAHLVGRSRASGRAISVADGQIAAIAKVHGFAVATRDVAPFISAGVTVINPWESISP